LSDTGSRAEHVVLFALFAECEDEARLRSSDEEGKKRAEEEAKNDACEIVSEDSESATDLRASALGFDSVTA
jgi:hypothetical protein